MSRLAQLHRLLNAEGGSSTEVEAVRLRDVRRAYIALRSLDALNAGRDKHIVLDLDTDAALQSVLNQVLTQSASVLNQGISTVTKVHARECTTNQVG